MIEAIIFVVGLCFVESILALIRVISWGAAFRDVVIMSGCFTMWQLLKVYI